MSLIHNERTKLLANALDRASTACLAVGVLGQALSLPPADRLWVSLLSPAGWICCAWPTFRREARSRKVAAMTVEIFFWYILPLGIAAASFGWIVYDRRRSRRISPGE